MAKTAKVLKVKEKKQTAVENVKKEEAKPVAAKVAKPKAVEVKKAEKAVKEVAKEVAKEVVKETTKEQPKKVEKKVVEAKKEAEKITSKPEPKKIAAKKEPKKIAAKKEPNKITSKPEPLKIVETKVAKVEEVKNVDTKPKAVKAEAAPKAKAATKEKKATKPEASEPKKKAIKKVEKAAPSKEKLAHYEALSMEECISLAQAMNVNYRYDDYYTLLLDEADLSVLEKNIIEGNNIKEMNLDFEVNGYDEDLVMVTLLKVAASMEVKAVDYKELKKSIKAALKFKISNDGEVNAAQYLDEFKVSEKLLMIAQRKAIATVVDEGTLIDADVQAYFQHFFDFAYALLPQWQYSDIKFYEDFAYAILSQFSDLYESDQLRVQMDVADLYIQHGDYAHGDEMYGYILRDNQIKDFIYYRYASIYKEIDYNKAKSIAYSSLQFVDDRFTYYPNIMEIINK